MQLRPLQSTCAGSVCFCRSLPGASGRHRERRTMQQLALSSSSQMPANRTAAVAEDFRISAPNINLTVLPDALKKDCVLFYCADAAPLAQKIAESSSKVTLGEIAWK